MLEGRFDMLGAADNAGVTEGGELLVGILEGPRDMLGIEDTEGVFDG